MLSQEHAVRELRERAERWARLRLGVLKTLCLGVLGFLLRSIGSQLNTPVSGLKPPQTDQEKWSIT